MVVAWRCRNDHLASQGDKKKGFYLIARLSDTVAMECAPLNMLRGPAQGMGGLMFQAA